MAMCKSCGTDCINLVHLPDSVVRAVIERLSNKDAAKIELFAVNGKAINIGDSHKSLYNMEFNAENRSYIHRVIEALAIGHNAKAWIELLCSIQRYDLLELVGSSKQCAAKTFTTVTNFPLVCRLLLDLYDFMGTEREDMFRNDVETRMNRTSHWISTRVGCNDLKGCTLQRLLCCLADKRGIEELNDIFCARSNVEQWYHECARKVHEYQNGQQYPIDRTPVGICLIVNIKNFTGPKLERVGSEHDLELLETLFADLRFIIKSLTNCTLQELQTHVDSISKEDHGNYSAFVCILMSHGENGKIVCSDRKMIDIKSEIIQKFNGKNCPSLLRKPKLFFIQACRGNSFNFASDSCTTKVNHSNHAVGKLKFPFSIKTSDALHETHDEADVLVSYATVENWPALRSVKGTPYVSVLVRHLRDLSANNDIVQILTKVNKEVSNSVQQSEFTSTLCKELRFNRPKK